jgi:hypothetical protein
MDLLGVEEQFNDNLPYENDTKTAVVTKKETNNKNLNKEELDSSDPKKMTRIRNRLYEPWTKAISRDYAESIHYDRDPKPPVGAYHPKMIRMSVGTRIYDREMKKNTPKQRPVLDFSDNDPRF